MADSFKPQFVNNLVTPKGRISFPHLSKPDENGRYSDGKYKATLIIPKDANLSALKAGVLKVAQETWGPNIKLKELAHPFRDGDEKADKMDAYAGSLFITCKTKSRPTVVGPDRKGIDPDEVYGGCDARFVVTAMSYETYDKRTKKTVKGVTFLLDIVQKIADNDRFGGGADVSVLDDGEVRDDAAPSDDEDGPTDSELFGGGGSSSDDDGSSEDAEDDDDLLM